MLPALRTTPVRLLASLILLALAARPAASGVFLSELCDPLNNFSTDRFIEIYNSGPSPVDLTGWSIVAVANSGDVLTWPLSGTIPVGAARVAGYTAPATGFTVHFQNAAWNTNVNQQGSYNWNGKSGDGAKLKDDHGTVVDIMVATGDLFNDKDLVRVASVMNPNPVYTPSEWTATPVNLATDASPGPHNGSAPPAGGPVVTNVVTDPSTPAAGTPVDVEATVTDTSAAVAAVTLMWGTSAGSLTNAIGMPNTMGSVYRTSTPIPGMSGVTVYYRVQAQDDSSLSAQSAIQSYALGGGSVPPSVFAVGEMSDSTLLVNFSEPVEQVSAEYADYYSVDGTTAVAAVRDPVVPSRVLITVRGLLPGTRTLTVNGVADLDGETAYGATRTFNYVDVTIPTGYYDSVTGLKGSALLIALHNLIKNHAAGSYSGALESFKTTDVKWNGKVWDVYSDVPGGTPPYEYSFGQTGQGATENKGYNREHSFPASWFNDHTPTYSDLWVLYPTDAKVNGYRSNYAYGVVGSASVVSMNGSKLGTSASPGFSGTVFEPIDAFKGDLVRSTFYVSTRYNGEDAGWATNAPATYKSTLYPWASQQYLAWSNADPVSWKERMRNGAIYVIQHNRNPFVDHPEFAAMIWDSNAVVTGVEPRGATALALRSDPNPFDGRTTIGFALAARAPVSLRIYDVAGRLVRTLASGQAMEPGAHRVDWDGRDGAGARLRAGLYLCRLDAGAARETRRLIRVR